jgi:hypothetical protein
VGVLLEIDIGKLLPVVVTHHKAGGLFLDCPGRGKSACSHCDFNAAKKPCERLYAFRSDEEDRSGVIGPTTQRGHVRGAQGDEARPPGDPRRLCFFSPIANQPSNSSTDQGGGKWRAGMIIHR